MRDGKLGAGARALILRSCDLLLADAILPTRVFKNYVPRAYDNPVYQAVNLPRHYEQTIEETPVQSAAMLRRAARTQSRESTGSSQTETRGDSLTPVEEAGAHQTSPMRPLSASIEELSSDVNSSTEHERTEVKKDYVDSLRHMGKSDTCGSKYLLL
ncbi:hypothetical protein BC829DRAFT_391604 [Chytridium lagenaria]|nr:hypothetical protein BC829DRAFT_391604 [Chytridium lagenaria]